MKLYARAWAGHHVGDAVSPSGVVRRFFVLCGRFGVFIDLYQDEAGRIVGLLNDVETSHAGLAQAGFGVRARGRDESVDVLCFDVNVNVHHEHVPMIGRGTGAAPVICARAAFSTVVRAEIAE
jgi:hypothetical protein